VVNEMMKSKKALTGKVIVWILLLIVFFALASWAIYSLVRSAG